MNLDELSCRIWSIIDFILRQENDYIVTDDKNNLYRRGKKYKANKSTIRSGGVFTGDGWVLDDIKNGVRFYYKR